MINLKEENFGQFTLNHVKFKVGLTQTGIIFHIFLSPLMSSGKLSLFLF